ncbi:beta-galactosidase [Ktedonobacter racemifer]|uniref:Glycoside hydrolase family 42 domain protein n=1 Tax=Ktedonobacter racemifer DSM 44963 TaxID=485913 RepID=D6U0F5_KTERA|nr:beta-galactosidase [Ktedonobacter racemifer]EFH82295.1 glycoside hydrolase family 42 domain protein [Ktedonobacter racemifer DSM 44963]
MLQPLPTNKNMLVFLDATYPGGCSPEELTRLVPGDFQVANAQELPTALAQGCALLVSFHGAYFPEQAWPAILRFLQQGGNLAIFGGMPFTRPVDSEGNVLPEQQAYTEQLYLGPFYPLHLPTTSLRLAPSEEAAFLREQPWQLSGAQVGNFWSFYPMLTQANDQPTDLGSSGPIDTQLTPLLFLRNADEAEAQPLAAPLMMLDQRSGHFKGGRWLISPWRPATKEDWLANADALQKSLLLAAEGTHTLEARPQFACYQPGEAPTVLVSTRSRHTLQARVTISAPDGEILETRELTFPGGIAGEQRVQLPTLKTPGLYEIEVSTHGAQITAIQRKNGFWLWDEALVESTKNKRLTAGRDYLYQQGERFHIFGTTYMDSQVQRKFLTLPNPARWERDFAAMKRAGINLIRTGIWTAWRDFMFVAGIPNEAALRALDAFVMTAARHDIQVIFNFFAFSPPLFEGENPWLDLRSIEGQQEFVAAFARHYAAVESVSWDLINEPSFGDPKRIFSERPIPNYDRFELAAFQQWLMQRYSLAELRARWRETTANLERWEQVSLPQARDYETTPRYTANRHMLKVMDYTLFSQEIFTRWVEHMNAAIRDAGSQTLIGVGQDEAGARISPQFYAPVVDYTTTHPWWNIDDMLCDMLLDKTVGKPNLQQEVGVMFVRDVDGRPWRSEQEQANLLERKFIMTLIARSAGMIQWLWHINAYMANENENSIGLVRADGSAKPELGVMLEFGRLMQSIQPHLAKEGPLPEVWVVIPYSQWFVRPELAIEAIRQSIRVLGYDFGIVPQVVGEHQLVELAQARHQPRFIFAPGIQTFDTDAWQALQSFVERGSTLFVSGVVTRDTHNRQHVPAMFAEGAQVDEPGPVSHYEYLEGEGLERCQLSFEREKLSYIRKAHNRLKVFHLGKGKITWSGVPLEHSASHDVLRQVYQLVLDMESKSIQQDNPVLAIKQPLGQGGLALYVSESAQPERLEVQLGLWIEVLPNRAGAVLIQGEGVTCFGGVQLCAE